MDSSARKSGSKVRRLVLLFGLLGRVAFADGEFAVCPAKSNLPQPAYLELVERVRAGQLNEALQYAPLLSTLKLVNRPCYEAVVEWLDLRLSDDLVVEAGGATDVVPRLASHLRFNPRSHLDLERAIGLLVFLTGHSKMQINRSVFREYLLRDTLSFPGVPPEVCAWFVSTANTIFNTNPGGGVAGDGQSWDMPSR